MKRATLLIWIIALAVAGFGLYRIMVKRPAPPLVDPATATGAPLIRVAAVEIGTVEQTIRVTGTILPDYRVDLVPETSGILEVFALPDGTAIQEGMSVRAGEIVAVIGRRHLEAALREAETGLEVARSSSREAEVHLNEARRERDRMQTLYEERVISEQERDRVLTALEAAAARQQLAEDRIKQAEAALKSVRLRYEDSRVKAPVSGIISEKYLDSGSYVTPQRPLATITNLDYVEVKGGVSERHAPYLRPGITPAQVSVDAYPEMTFPGVVHRVQPEATPATRTFDVSVRLQNPQHRLKPGMFARVSITIARREDVPTVTDEALFEAEDGYAVFVVEDQTVRQRAVRLGLREDDVNEVIHGLNPGESVVIRGRHLLQDGMEVQTEQ